MSHFTVITVSMAVNVFIEFMVFLRVAGFY